MQYLGLFFTFTFPGILVGILLAASKFFEDKCGVIKGLGNVVTQEEIDLVEWYICNEIMHGRA